MLIQPVAKKAINSTSMELLASIYSCKRVMTMTKGTAARMSEMRSMTRSTLPP